MWLIYQGWREGRISQGQGWSEFWVMKKLNDSFPAVIFWMEIQQAPMNFILVSEFRNLDAHI